MCYCKRHGRNQQPQDGSIRKRVFIQASAATIYRALTDAKALSSLVLRQGDLRPARRRRTDRVLESRQDRHERAWLFTGN